MLPLAKLLFSPRLPTLFYDKHGKLTAPPPSTTCPLAPSQQTAVKSLAFIRKFSWIDGGRGKGGGGRKNCEQNLGEEGGGMTE